MGLLNSCPSAGATGSGGMAGGGEVGVGVSVGVFVNLGVGVRVGMFVGWGVAVGSGVSVRVDVSVGLRVGVDVAAVGDLLALFLIAGPPATSPPITASMAKPPSTQTHVGTCLRGTTADSALGITFVAPGLVTTDRGGDGASLFNAAAISCGVEKRSSTVSSIARSITASTLGEICLFNALGGWNAPRLAMRCVAVGGACPVRAW